MPSRRRGRDYYLSDIPVDDARRRFYDALEAAGAPRLTSTELLPLDRANGRVTAEPVWAQRSSPHYDAAAMDGVAVRSAETAGATETPPRRLSVPQQAVWVDTGDPMPDGFDAVIMVEVVHEVDDATIEVQAPVTPFQHVRPLGEDIVATELVLPQGHRLRPQDLAACAAAGVTQAPVQARPTVAVIPTGTELVPMQSQPQPGQIVEFNSVMLAAIAEDAGADAIRLPPVPDDFVLIKKAIVSAARGHDIVVVNAGSSAGSEDFTARAVADLGVLALHGVALRPGHPLVLGVVEGKPVIGIPGYPVSAAVTADLFLKPLIERMLGVAPARRQRASAILSRKVQSPSGEDEYLRVRLGRVGERLVATPIQRGAGVIMSMVRADGLVLIPRFSEGVDAGATVEVELLRPAEQIEKSIVAIGSHDLTLDLIASELRRIDPELTLSSSNVGSLGGLLALSRGEAHVAGCHLLDEASGEYNVSYVRKYVKGRPVVILNLVNRLQGLIVQPGNPRGVNSLGDLTRPDVAFVNRQRGSGTRVLLDYRLRLDGIAPETVRGYQREEYTHLAVAAAVAAGRADTGLGILSAARAMGLGFVPLLSEQYDLVVPEEHYGSALLGHLLELVRTEGFKTAAEALGGYDTRLTGQVIEIVR
ncbi:MAG: molybdopterin biosynthesis protein [SAR202 cluster bacterium]|nr:molybdopterin biosynthesis protein [SAR202 cluster bacterium]